MANLQNGGARLPHSQGEMHSLAIQQRLSKYHKELLERSIPGTS